MIFGRSWALPAELWVQWLLVVIDMGTSSSFTVWSVCAVKGDRHCAQWAAAI